MVITCTNQDEAVSLVRRSVTDLVILKDKIETRYTSAVALAAEYNNPQAVTFLLTERSRVQSFELFELVPSLHAVLSARPNFILRRTPPSSRSGSACIDNVGISHLKTRIA